jgi:CRISPR-associated protein Cas2
MLVLITYDVNTETSEGKTRLRKISKECINFGQRVQNSVFECNIQWGTYLQLKAKLLKIYDDKKDSLRIYLLGNKWENKVEHFGTKESYNPEGFLMA